MKIVLNCGQIEGFLGGKKKKKKQIIEVSENWILITRTVQCGAYRHALVLPKNYTCPWGHRPNNYAHIWYKKQTTLQWRGVYFTLSLNALCAAIAQSVQRLATGWTVPGSNPCAGDVFRNRQTGPGAHPTTPTMGTGSVPKVKRPGRDVDHPSNAEVKERVELYLYPKSGPSWPVIGRNLPLPLSLPWMHYWPTVHRGQQNTIRVPYRTLTPALKGYVNRSFQT